VGGLENSCVNKKSEKSRIVHWSYERVWEWVARIDSNELTLWRVSIPVVDDSDDDDDDLPILLNNIPKNDRKKLKNGHEQDL